MSEQNIGTVVQITGPVLDIKFAADALPKLLNAITIDNNGHVITVEVAQHIGQDTVRCIAMESTDGLMRGMKATDTGGPITVPVGDKNLGRIFNLLGQPVDNALPICYRSSSDSGCRSGCWPRRLGCHQPRQQESGHEAAHGWRRRCSGGHYPDSPAERSVRLRTAGDRKSTRLNSSHR